MKEVAALSPLNWAHKGFIDIFLRGSSILDISPELIKLLAFFVITVGFAGIYRKLKPPMG
jgi:ABC-2 type transport system permease protein